MDLLSSLHAIDTFVLDIDGVLTNSELLVMPDGNLLRTMHTKDGYAMQLAFKKKYKIIIISGAKNDGLYSRLSGLGLSEVHLGINNKVEVLQKLVAEGKANLNSCLYMGDDMPDIECMQMVRIAAAPADACKQVLAIAHYVSPCKGGNACVRDVIEKVLTLKGDWE